MSLIANSNAGGSLTSPSLDSTGATLIVVGVTSIDFACTSVTDSKSNTWTALSSYNATRAYVRMFYCLSPSSVGSGHTFTADCGGQSAASCQPSIMVAVFNDSPLFFDRSTGAGASSGSSVQPGSITPTTTNELFVTSACLIGDPAANPAVDSSFTADALINFSSGLRMSSGQAYKYSSSAENPTWSVSASTLPQQSATMATFSSVAPPAASSSNFFPFL